MGVLHPWKDVEEDSLDTNNTNPKCQGVLVGVVEDNEEILWAVAGARISWGGIRTHPVMMRLTSPMPMLMFYGWSRATRR
jgi:hypothetical protein